MFHSRYKFPNESEIPDIDELEDHMKEMSAIKLKIYLYDHSGITIKAAESNPFSCPWDSGMIGYIWISREDAKKEFGYKRSSRKMVNKVKEAFRNEIEAYDQFLRGEVYGFELCIWDENDNEEFVDSCWGYFGSDSIEKDGYLISEVLSNLSEENKQLLLSQL
jgi:hypothetical protein